ncbi:hypothetical protein [Zhongshania sp.]|uniref:hypothetical protein n=1 Tax=Zhongshania sp. TaxID=1971902 RepID=UPI003565F2EC
MPFLRPQADRLGHHADLFLNEAPQVAQFSDISQGGFDAARQLFPQASQQLGQTIGGEFLGANPYLQNVAARAQQGAMSGINATFGGAGRTGGGLHQQALAEGLGNVAAGIYAPAYESERSRMLAATQMAPQQLAGQLGIGGVMEAKDLEQQLAPYTQLQRYGQLITMPGGGTSTVTGPGTPGRGAGAGALGGALAGASLGAMEGSIGGPWGAAIGGGLGLLGVI